MLQLRLLAVLVLVSSVAPACPAQVKWEKTEVLLDLDSSQPGGEAVFRFVNEGTAPVKIVKIAPGCGCTVPLLEKSEFAAGEAGSFVLGFSTGERRGAYQVPVHVLFEDGTTAELSLVAQIRELVKYFPPSLAWGSGEKRTPKSVELHWNATDDVKVTGLRSINSSFKAELIPGHDWNGALVRITPNDDSVVGTSVVIMTTAQGPDRRSRTYTVVARAL